MKDRTYIYNAKCFDTAQEVDNYPWGYTLKTKRRYWVETTKHGDRLVYCTLNPKNNRWCKPKKNTYSGVLVLYRDENDYVQSYGIGKYNADQDRLANLVEELDYNKLTDMQKATICEYNSVAEVLKKVTWTFKPRGTDAEENAKNDQEQAKTKAYINHAINRKINACLTKNGLQGAR